MAGLSLGFSLGIGNGGAGGAPAPTPTPAPSWSVQPSITGAPQVGQTLTGNDGTISDGTVSARSWLRNGSAISGANGSTYLLVSGDEGANIAFKVTATGAGGSADATSASVGPIAAAPAPAPTAPGYLSTAVTPYAAYGSQRVVSGYSGNVFKLRRTSDNSLQDFACQSGGDYPDYSAIIAWAGSSLVRVNTWYDQTGNARNLSASSTSLEPWLDLDHPVNGVYPVIFDHYQKILEVGGLSLDVTTLTYAMVRMTEPRIRETATLQFTNEAGTTAYLGHGGSSEGWPRVGAQATFGTGQWAPPVLTPRLIKPGTTAPDIYAVNATGKVGTVLRSSPAWSSTLTSQAVARLQVGVNTVGATHNAAMWLAALVIYANNVSQTDGPTIWNSLRTAYNTMPSVSYPYVATIAGDSIVDGSTTTLLRTAPQWLREQLTQNALIYNKGFAGDTMNSAYSARTSRYGGTTNLHSGIPNLVFIQPGTNDLAGVSPLTTASALYTTATNLVTYLKGLSNTKAILCTLLPRNDGSWNSTREAERIAYNDLVRANSAGADYVLDLASHPVMGLLASTSDTSLYSDLIHPANLGQRYLAGAPSGTYANQYTYYYALREVLRTALANPSYVP